MVGCIRRFAGFDHRPLQVTSIVVVVCLIGACRQEAGPGTDQDIVATQEVADHQDIPSFSAGFYSGTLPCASCPGIETNIWFDSDQTYRRKQTYLEVADGAGTSTDFGRWTVAVGGVVLRSTDRDATRFSVETGGEIRLLGLNGARIDSQANLSLRIGPRDLADVGPVTMLGMYTYFADAAIFRPCNMKTTYPVAMVRQHVDLESVYLKHRSEPGAPLLVRVDAWIEDHPTGEGDAMRRSVAVAGVGAVYPGQSCFPDRLLADSLGWRLTELGGISVTVPENQVVPTLTFETDSVKGSSGCNSLSGSIQSTETMLSFGPLASTRRACPGDLETTFIRQLEVVDGYEIYGDLLELSSKGMQVAVFESGAE